MIAGGIWAHPSLAKLTEAFNTNVCNPLLFLILLSLQACFAFTNGFKCIFCVEGEESFVIDGLQLGL